MPITVLSRNILAYGPAQANGLTTRVNSDGSLHVSGQTTAANQGIKWRFPIPDDIKGKTVTYKLSTAPAGVYCYAQARNSSGVLATLLTSSPTQKLPETATEIELRVATNTTNPIDGDIKVQVEPGETATTWMSPDTLDLAGGGLELANLWPAFASERGGVTLTPNGDGSFTLNGTATAGTQLFTSSQHLAAGVYQLGVQPEGLPLTCRVHDSQSNVKIDSSGPAKQFTIPTASSSVSYQFLPNSGATFTDTIVAPTLVRLDN